MLFDLVLLCQHKLVPWSCAYPRNATMASDFELVDFNVYMFVWLGDGDGATRCIWHADGNMPMSGPVEYSQSQK